jgi:hypothetical protein
MPPIVQLLKNHVTPTCDNINGTDEAKVIAFVSVVVAHVIATLSLLSNGRCIVAYFAV